jgi:hypothetical protein
MQPVSPVIPGHDLPEIKIAEHQPEFQTLPAIHRDGVTITRWQLDDEERKRVAEGGDIYLLIERGNHPLQPVMMQTQPPKIENQQQALPCPRCGYRARKPVCATCDAAVVRFGPALFIIPSTLDECFAVLLEMLVPEDIKAMSEMPERDMIQFHHNLGRWIRNNWGLWRKHSNLYDYFIALGIQHPDDMSGIILASFWRHLHDEPLGSDDQIAHYKAYWKHEKV